MTDNTSKYPSNIQKLFTPKLPLLYREPLDYVEESRRTHYISPIASFKSQLAEYVKEDVAATDAATPHAPSTQLLNTQRRKDNQKKYTLSLKIQIHDWDDPELLAQNEKEFLMKDPYRTVFVSRLPYAVTELQISKSFSKYGIIESIRIIRDKLTGKSRGYAFIVYERDSDAKSCVRELASTGLRMEAEGESDVGSSKATASNDGKNKSRIVLVDIERGRLLRSWKPRRLGGGLGGRHYTKPTALMSSNASAAASGRRLHLSSNPYDRGGNTGSGGSRPYQARPNYREYGGQGQGSSYASSYPPAPKSVASQTKIQPADAHPPTPVLAASYSYTSRSSESRSAESMRDKNGGRSDRSIRSIRNG